MSPSRRHAPPVLLEVGPQVPELGHRCRLHALESGRVQRLHRRVVVGEQDRQHLYDAVELQTMAANVLIALICTTTWAAG